MLEMRDTQYREAVGGSHVDRYHDAVRLVLRSSHPHQVQRYPRPRALEGSYKSTQRLMLTADFGVAYRGNDPTGVNLQRGFIQTTYVSRYAVIGP